MSSLFVLLGFPSLPVSWSLKTNATMSPQRACVVHQQSWDWPSGPLSPLPLPLSGPLSSPSLIHHPCPYISPPETVTVRELLCNNYWSRNLTTFWEIIHLCSPDCSSPGEAHTQAGHKTTTTPPFISPLFSHPLSFPIYPFPTPTHHPSPPPNSLLELN